MQVKMVIFPGEDGLDVLVWGRRMQGTMRHRHFDCRTSMIAMLKNLRLLTPEDVQKPEDFVFVNSCPLYRAEIQEEVLAAHGFHSA